MVQSNSLHLTSPMHCVTTQIKIFPQKSDTICLLLSLGTTVANHPQKLDSTWKQNRWRHVHKVCKNIPSGPKSGTRFIFAL